MSDLDVDLTQPTAAAGGKGRFVQPLKCYTSWVQNDVSQFGFYLMKIFENYEDFDLV